MTARLASLAAFVLSVMWPGAVSANTSIETKLERVFERRQHVRYVFGGCDDSRMDCSCFVQKTFQEAFSTDIPRSTLGQARFFERDLLARLRSTRQLAPETLCPGDLIYTYRGDIWQRGARHVAIYAGKGRILHAARDVGVAMQSLQVLSHHRLKGVVRLFECRGAGAASRRSAPPPPRPSARRAENVLRDAVQRFFHAWHRSDKEAFERLWAPGALQWLEQPGATGGDVMADRHETFERLRGRPWPYSIRSLRVRGRSAFVELASELRCGSLRAVGCGLQIQTFIWRLGDDGAWRIEQHEIGASE